MPPRAKPVVLAMDIGSSSLRTALFTHTGRRIGESTAARQYTVRYTDDGGAELDAREILRAARACLKETIHHADQRGSPIIAVAGSAIWHSLLGLDRRGEPITPIFTWADSRPQKDATQLRQEIHESAIHQRTGCMLRAPYWPAKLRWLRRANRALFARTARWISPGTWIFEKLFEVGLTSHSMASGTGLYNLQRRDWDVELCRLSKVRPDQLGKIGDECLTSRSRSHIPRDTPVCPALGDGAAGNLGSGADEDGKIAINIGTSAAARKIAGRVKIPPGLFGHVVDGRRFLVGGAISNAGNLRQWCLRELRLEDNSLARLQAAQDRLTVLPFWINERAPTWPEDLPGTIIGLNSTTSAEEILRAATTSSYYRLADILERLTNDRDPQIIVSGGVLHSRSSLEILADCLGRKIQVCHELESSLRGAAVHALEKIGCDVRPLRAGRIISARPELAERHRVRRERQNSLERKLS